MLLTTLDYIVSARGGSMLELILALVVLVIVLGLFLKLLSDMIKN